MINQPDDLVRLALEKRSSLIDDPKQTAYRLFNGHADGIDGLIVEQWGDVLVVQIHQDRLKLPQPQVQSLAERICKTSGARAVYRKHFVRDRSHVDPAVEAEHRDRQPWIGEPVDPALLVCENDLRFEIHPYDGFSVGLFLEHRDNRQRIRRMAAGRRVLNAFSYTGGFSVAAAAGGAVHVASVDLSKRYLEWSKRNFAANDLSTDPHRFYCSDLFKFYRRARRQKLRYDLIVLDPPTFGRVRRPARTFVLADCLERMVKEAVELLDRGGQVLLATNHREIDQPRLEAAMQNAGGPYAPVITETPPLPIDFAGDPDYTKTVIARYD